MRHNLGARVYRKALGPLCVCILGVILTAGLWPFHSPANNVEWLSGDAGLRFGHHGIVISANPFRMSSPDGACSLEILLVPEGTSRSGTILAFDSSPDPKFAFALRQFGDALAVQRSKVDKLGIRVRPWLRADRVFEQGKPVVLTITGSQDKTAVYVNGVRAKVSSEFGLVNSDLTGHLVLGNSTVKDSWSGQVNQLAVYDFELTPSEIATHFVRGTHKPESAVNGKKAPVALYLFEENTGSVVHDRTSSANHLVIPKRYIVLHPPFLHPAWDQFRSRWDGWMSWGYWSDVLLNVAGFVPLGFFFMAYLSFVRPVIRPWVLVFILGLAISLLIEVLQHFLPTRDSSMTDVVTNTLGTVAGVALYRSTLLARMLNQPSL